MTVDVEALVDAVVRDVWTSSVTVRDWWAALDERGLSDVTLPGEHDGLGLRQADMQHVFARFAHHRVLGPPAGIGTMLAVPTMVAHGSAEVIDRFLRPTLRGEISWCQLFSEPGSGSDLASVRTVVETDPSRDRLVANGQKVWTSGAQAADWGLLLARTDTTAPKHAGMSYYLIDMHQPGIEVRPLKEMTGRSLFCEVFLNDAVVEPGNQLGADGAGWAVARTTLAHERQALGARYNAGALGNAHPGTKAGDLSHPAAGFVVTDAQQSLGERTMELLTAAGPGRAPSPTVDCLILNRLSELLVERMRAGSIDPTIAGSILKLHGSDLFLRYRQAMTEMYGMGAVAHPHGSDGEKALAAEVILWSCAPSIYGGTDQIQRNILAERALGLPKDSAASPPSR